MKKEEFLEEMKWFLEFYDKRLNQTQGKIWWENFKYYPRIRLHNALCDHISKAKENYFPAIGVIAEKLLPFRDECENTKFTPGPTPGAVHVHYED